MGNLLIVDDNINAAIPLPGHNTFQYAYNTLETPKQTAGSIADKCLSENNNTKIDAILINAEGKFPVTNARQDLMGIEIIFWLRLQHNITLPIILYGFQSLAQILAKHPDKIIITAPGNSYVQLPDGFTSLSLESIIQKLDGQLSSEADIKYKYQAFLEASINIDKIRHKEANWWGIKALWDTHTIVTEEQFSAKYPNKVSSCLEALDGYVLDYLYKDKVLRLKELLDKEKSEAQSSLNEIKQKLLETDQKILRILEKIDEDWADLRFAFVDKLRIKDRRKSFSNTSNEYQQLQQELEDTLQYVEYCKDSLIAAYQKHTSTLIEHDDLNVEFEELRNSFDELLSTFKKRFELKTPITQSILTKKVLLIDDQAEDGWANIYSQIIYGKNTDNLVVVDVKNITRTEEDKVDSLATIISGYFNKDSAHFDQDIGLILLDIRLFPETDNISHKTPDVFSGVKLLSAIRKLNPTIPIVITSASNKTWTTEIVRKHGADAYWTKEGVDNLWSAQETWDNYFKLIRLVNASMAKEYTILRDLNDLLEFTEIDENCWWEHGIWRNGESKQGDTVKVRALLNNSIIQLKRHCRDFVMHSGYKLQDKESTLSLANLGNTFGSIFEAMVGLNNANYNTDKPKISARIGMDKDEEFINLRNLASHSDSLSLFNIYGLAKMSKELEKVIKLSPVYERPHGWLLQISDSFEINETEVAVSMSIGKGSIDINSLEIDDIELISNSNLIAINVLCEKNANGNWHACFDNLKTNEIKKQSDRLESDRLVFKEATIETKTDLSGFYFISTEVNDFTGIVQISDKKANKCLLEGSKLLVCADRVNNSPKYFSEYTLYKNLGVLS